jgi:hypothetical protein
VSAVSACVYNPRLYCAIRVRFCSKMTRHVMIAGRQGSSLCRRRPSRANEEEPHTAWAFQAARLAHQLQARESVWHCSEGADAMRSPRHISISCDRMSHSLIEESRGRDSEDKVTLSLGLVFAHEPDGSSMDYQSLCTQGQAGSFHRTQRALWRRSGKVRSIWPRYRARGCAALRYWRQVTKAKARCRNRPALYRHEVFHHIDLHCLGQENMVW